jgi:5-methylcytosine-specific restriction endonuclease McrA
MKIDRVKVHEKYNGCCGYCGKQIALKEMQVDHITPLWTQSTRNGRDPSTLNDFSNLMPTCRRCNHYKRGDNLEQFRDKMKTLHLRACGHYIGKVAIDYNIVTIHPFDGTFYFEKL